MRLLEWLFGSTPASDVPDEPADVPRHRGAVGGDCIPREHATEASVMPEEVRRRASGTRPEPMQAARLLGEAAAAAPEDTETLAAAAGLLAESVRRGGGIAERDASMLTVRAGDAAREAAKAVGIGRERAVKLAERTSKAAALGALIGQACLQYGEHDAIAKAYRLVCEEMAKPDPVPAAAGFDERARIRREGRTTRVVVGSCEQCGRALRVKERGIRPRMRLTCKCGHVNLIERAESSG